MDDPPTAAPPPLDPDSALPSVTARVVAFVAILAGGLLGGIIGTAFVNLQCDGDCSVPSGLGMMVGSVVGAAGVAVVAVLTLRAFGEWRSIQRRSDRPTTGPVSG